MTNLPIPPPNETIAVPESGKITDIWWRFLNATLGGLNTLDESTSDAIADVVSDVADLTATVAGLSFSSSLAIQVVTGDATYTPTADTTHVIVIATGGGGGGGGADTTAGTFVSAGGGGEAGGTVIKIWTAAQLGASAAVTMGTAGTAGTNNGGNGGDGGDTVIDPAGSGSTLTAAGGDGGDGLQSSAITATQPGGVGEGTATNGDVNILGGEGGYGFAFASDTSSLFRGIGGVGGASFWGGGGQSITLVGSGNTAAGRNGTAFGSGGSGGICLVDTGGIAGGAGKIGIAVFIEMISS